MFCVLNVILSLSLLELCCKLLTLSDVCFGKAGEIFLLCSKKFSTILKCFFKISFFFLKKDFKSFNIKNIFSKGTVEGISVFFFFFFFKNFYFIYLFLAALGPRCCTRALSSCGEQGLLFTAVHGLLIVVTSPAAEHGL